MRFGHKIAALVIRSDFSLPLVEPCILELYLKIFMIVLLVFRMHCCWLQLYSVTQQNYTSTTCFILWHIIVFLCMYSYTYIVHSLYSNNINLKCALDFIYLFYNLSMTFVSFYSSCNKFSIYCMLLHKNIVFLNNICRKL